MCPLFNSVGKIKIVHHLLLLPKLALNHGLSWRPLWANIPLDYSTGKVITGDTALLMKIIVQLRLPYTVLGVGVMPTQKRFRA